MENIKQWLIENSDQKYKEFSNSLVATDKMIGVRIPKLRSLAKQLVKEYGLDALELLSDDSFEEILLQGFVIGYAKEIIELKEAFIYDYLLKCDNWSLVDSFASTIFLKGVEKDIFYDILTSWRKDSHEYVVRFVLVCYLRSYLDDEHIDDILSFCQSLTMASYPVKMANGWLLATAYISYADKVLENSKKLDDETFRMTKGKIRDSFRISKEEKERFVR